MAVTQWSIARGFPARQFGICDRVDKDVEEMAPGRLARPAQSKSLDRALSYTPPHVPIKIPHYSLTFKAVRYDDRRHRPRILRWALALVGKGGWVHYKQEIPFTCQNNDRDWELSASVHTAVH
jgi:hypothetical protein